MSRWFFTCVMIVVMGADVYAKPSDHDLFGLCPPFERMNLFVEEIDDDARTGGLTTEKIRNAAESRLRGAGLYNPETRPRLYIGVIAGTPERGSGHYPFFSINVMYQQRLVNSYMHTALGALLWEFMIGLSRTDPERLKRAQQYYYRLQDRIKRGTATTWSSRSAGQGDSSFILSSLGEHLDEFLVEYLRVRDSAECRDLRVDDGI